MAISFTEYTYGLIVGLKGINSPTIIAYAESFIFEFIKTDEIAFETKKKFWKMTSYKRIELIT